MSRLPFASGQPLAPRERDGSLPGPGLDPRGCALLHQIRALARDEAEALEPRCEDRRINRELISADPLAIAQRETYEAMQFVIDRVLADPDLAERLAGPLAQRFPR